MSREGLIDEENFVKLMEYMSECDYRIREGANPRLQLEALISKFLLVK
jgi:replication factor C small subunit